MGQHLMRRPPKFVQGFVDRHGKPRFYFRRPGYRKAPLPGLPWSPEFMAAYEVSLAGSPIPIGLDRVKPGSIRALAMLYFASAEFTAMRPSSQVARRRIIEKFCRQTDRLGNPYGDKRVVTLQRENVVKLLTRRADKPEAANALRKALRAMMRHAVAIGLRHDDPTRDVPAIRTKTAGVHSWSEDEIVQYELCHPIGSRARLALALLLFSGQRRSDVVPMGRQHVRNGILNVKQQKTGIELAIPVHPDLAAIIDSTPAGHLSFLTTQYNRPFTSAGFGNWFRQQCNAAGLPHCSAHGLRKAAARRLAEAGCTEHEIAAITGHASLREIVRYTKAADQRRLAASAMDKVTSAKREQELSNLGSRFDNSGVKRS
jgi:integrase